MPSPFSLIGKIAVLPNCVEQVAQLCERLDPKGEEFVFVRADVLYVYLDSDSAPYCYVHEVMKVFADFCGEFATEAAIFQTADVPMLVGPKLRSIPRAVMPIFPESVPESDFSPAAFRPSDVLTYDLTVMH